MTAHLRLILLLVGIIILALVLWDVFKQRQLKKQQERFMTKDAIEPRFEYEAKQQSLDFGEAFESGWDNEDGDRNVELQSAFDLSRNAREGKYLRSELDICSNAQHVLQNSVSAPFIMDKSARATEFLPTSSTNKKRYSLDDIFALFVMARGTAGFAGSKLRETLEYANLSYGKMNIFHKYRDNNQNEVLFSVASAVEPGFFDLKKLTTQFIPGVTMFMVPSKVSDPKNAFDSLVRIAKQLAFSLNGELKDQYHNPLTLQIIDNYKHKIEACASKQK